MDSSPEYHGNVVALEGLPDVVDTQLRLLPTSAQILVLPSIQSSIKAKAIDRPFDARSFIREVHEASTIRHAQALEFLQGSTPSSKRLVFLNGGTVSAHTLCITAIRREEGFESYAKAEAIFTELVKEGLAGLVGPSTKPGSILSDQNGRETCLYEEVEIEDPSTSAMRAAEVLDRETESLQPNVLLPPAIHIRPRSSSLPTGSSPQQGIAEDTPLTIIDGSADEESPPRSTQRMGRGGFLDDAPKFHAHWRDSKSSSAVRMSTCSRIVATYAYAPTYNNFPRSAGDLACLSPLSELPLPSPLSPGKTVFEQAKVLDMAPLADTTALTRARSLERKVPARHIDLKRSNSAAVVNRDFIDRKKIDGQDARCYSWIGVPGPATSSRHVHTNIDLRRTVVCKANETTISRSTSRKRLENGLLHVEKDTDAVDTITEPTPTLMDGPVLPFTEDLVIQLAGDARHILFESIMHGFMTGIYPVACVPETIEIPDFPATPKTSEFPAPRSLKKPKSAIWASLSDEYDPFRPQSTCIVDDVPEPARSVKSSITATDLPTPAHTPPPFQAPPPPTKNLGGRFRVLRTSRMKSAMCIQNALRRELDNHYPSLPDNFCQKSLSILPGMDNLWRVAFDGATEPRRLGRDDRNIIPSTQKQRLDLVLAVGADEDVERYFAASVLEQMGRLGNVSTNGAVARSGRLDLRYLIDIALRMRPDQSPGDPLANPLMLATLVIPQLDMYLLAHPDVRFMLLEYPPMHFATMLALQNLMGEHIFKVACILSEQTPLERRDSARSIRVPHQVLQSFTAATQSLSLSNYADFTIAATAEDPEVDMFISDIWKTLVDASDFYSLDQMPIDPGSKPARHGSSSSRGTSILRLSTLPQETKNQVITSCVGTQTEPQSWDSSDDSSTRQNIKANRNRGRRRLESPTPSAKSRAFSITSTRTARTGKSRAARRTTMGTTGGNSIMDYYDPADDSDYDLEERRLMPLYMTHGQVPRKGNTMKALKWLGLA